MESIETTPRKKVLMEQNQPAISFEDIKKKIMSEDRTNWSVDLLQYCLLKLGQSISGLKETLAKRIMNLKNNATILEKVIQKKKLAFTFKSRLTVLQRDIPPPGAAWMADSNQYPKVTYSCHSSQDKFLFLD